MIETALYILTALAFGIGVGLTLFGLLLFHLIFIKEKKFNSWLLMTQIALFSTIFGSALLWIVLA